MIETQDFVGPERQYLSEAERKRREGVPLCTCVVCGREYDERGKPGICPGCGVEMNRTAKLDGSRGVDGNAAVYKPGPFNMTASELMGMRETGMTNRAIAKAINTTAYAVERLIGKTPPELVRQAQADNARSNNKKRCGTGAKSNAGTPRLKVTRPVIPAEGMCCLYLIDQDKNTVDIKPRGSMVEGIVNFEEMKELAAEFSEILKLIP